MGVAGTAVAMEAADVALMDSDLNKLAKAIEIGRATKRVIAQNIAFAIITKLVVVGLAVSGYAYLWLAVSADVGGMLIVTLWSMRLLGGATPPPSEKKEHAHAHAHSHGGGRVCGHSSTHALQAPAETNHGHGHSHGGKPCSGNHAAPTAAKSSTHGHGHSHGGKPCSSDHAAANDERSPEPAHHGHGPKTNGVVANQGPAASVEQALTSV